MNYGNYEDRLSIRRVGDQVVAHGHKPKRKRRQIRPLVALVRKCYELADRIENFFAHTARS